MNHQRVAVRVQHRREVADGRFIRTVDYLDASGFEFFKSGFDIRDRQRHAPPRRRAPCRHP